MAKNEELNADGLPDAVKYVNGNKEYHFLLPHDAEMDGYHTDANGNGKLPTLVSFDFIRVPVKDPISGKSSTKLSYCMFIADRKQHGKYYARIVRTLNWLLKQPDERLYTEDKWFSMRNPEAFAISKERDMVAKQLSAKDDVISEKDARIAELEKKLGIRKV